jgi:hypothetical protein
MLGFVLDEIFVNHRAPSPVGPGFRAGDDRDYSTGS